MKKIVAGILAFSLILGGIYFVAPEADEVQATGTEESAEQVVYTTETYTEVEAKTVQGYIDGKEVMKTDTYPGWLFAGWFTDKYCTEAVTSTVVGETYHAKFVDPDVLSVKLQITEGTDSESPTTNMRLVSSVDSLDYAQVGFEVYYDADITNEVITEDVKIQTVYERIVASSESGVEYNYSPKVVDTDSEYFVTATLVGIANGNFGKPFHIKPYWVTLSGAKVYGTSRYVTITDDALSTVETVNVPVKIAEADTYTVTDANDADSTSITYEKAYHDGTYAHFRMTAPTVSLTKYNVTATTEDGTETATAYHRNLETVYSGTSGSYVCGDKSWYEAYSNSEGVVEETEFVIATTADLYALPYIVNTDGESFSEKTIYVVADIVANSGYTIAGSAETQPAMSGGTGYRWEAIGTIVTTTDENSETVTEHRLFSGTFDGQGHTISGLNINAKPYYCGFFGAVNRANIRNFSLIESVFKTSVGTNSTTTDYTGGIVAYGNANLSNIYCDADINSYNQLGGLIGRVDYFSGYDTGAVTVEITNCHYAGIVYARSTGASVRSGGIIGYAVRGDIDISNTMFSGTIRVSAGADRIGGFIGDSNNYSISDIFISNSVSAGNITLINSSTSSTRIGSLVGRLNGTKTVKVDNVYTTNECYSVVYDATTDSSSSFNSEGSNPVQIEKNEYLLGLNAYHWTDLDFVNDWSLRENQLIIPRKLADSDYTITDDMKADTSWYTESETTYEIADAQDLYGLAKLVNAGNTFEGITLKLTSDIDLNEGWDGTLKIVDGGPVAPDEPVNEWIPIGTASNPFKGNFDGNQKTISGLYIDKRVADSNGTGLFGNTHNADDETQICTISNFALTNSYIYANNTDQVGGIVGSGEGSISNVYSAAGIYGVNNVNNGGIIGYVPHDTSDPYVCTISNCWYDGLYVLRTGSSSADQYVNAGGLVGCTMGGDTTIEHCLFTGTFNYKTGFTGNSTYEDYPVWPRMGGLVGRNNGTTSAVAIMDSVSAGSITATASGENATISQVGSIIGSERSTATSASTALRISNVYAMSDYNLPVAMSKDSSGVTVDVTSFVDTDGETVTSVNVKDDWATGIEELDENYWTMSTTIPVLSSLVDYAGRELP